VSSESADFPSAETFISPEFSEKQLSLGEATKELARRQKAKKDLIEYCKFMDEDYVPYDIHQLIASKLERVEAGLTRRLLITVPPAIGKSRLSSEFFPSWFFGKNPKLEVIATSYDELLARSFGRNVRNFLQHPRFGLLFPEVSLAADASAMAEWKTNQGGEYKAEGVGGGLVGFHGHVAIIDDPFKSYESAWSENQRRMVWEWYASVLLNRLRSYKGGPGAVICIMQRWHDDDLGGRLEKLHLEGEEEWDIVKVPSIAEEGDLLGRKPGEVLLPDGPNRRTLVELEQIRKRSPNIFMAVHQQKPFSDEGDLFKPGDLRLHSPSELPENLVYYGASDFALTKGGGDYTVHIVFGVCKRGHIWLRHVWRQQLDILETVAKCVDFMLEYEPLQWFFEKVHMQKAVGPVLTRERRERGAWTSCVDVSVLGKGRKDSPDRAGSIAGAVQMGYVHAPADAPWLAELLYEMVKFPNGKNDDQIDALALVGMKLNDLMLARDAEIPESLIVSAEPVALTFGDYVEMGARHSAGLRWKKGAIVVPYAGLSPLSEDWEPEAVRAN
jgi:predicted phage terminase large subunit-like protein